MKAPSNLHESMPSAYSSSIPQARRVVLEHELNEDMLLDPHCLLPKMDWVPQSERTACCICTKKFSAFRRRHNCRICGEVVCSRCSNFMKVDSKIVETKARVCCSCFLSYRKRNEASIPGIPSVDLPDTSMQYEPKKKGKDLNSVSAALRAAMAATETAKREEKAKKKAIKQKQKVSLKAAKLEKEVTQGRDRVKELEDMVENIVRGSSALNGGQSAFSAKEQDKLNQARSLINQLQEKLKQSEVKLLEMNKSTSASQSMTVDDLSSYQFTDNDIAEKLQRKFLKLERQILEAGLHVAEDIPYEEAKQKIKEISERMGEIGSSEVTHEDKAVQTALRKEYFVLEQEMERYNTALMMTEEFAEEQRQIEREWSAKHEVANQQALEKIRQCLPVNMSVLSEKQMTSITTPSGGKIQSSLAKKIKRTNVLELLRVPPDEISRMHPSVIETYRITGLSVFEKRALYVVLSVPAEEWSKQTGDEMCNRKFVWFKNLKQSFKSSLNTLEKHVDEHGQDTPEKKHSCNLIGRQCPFRAEQLVMKLYDENLGFPSGNEYHKREVMKGDPEGAGEKALAEAKAHAKAMIHDQRSRKLKEHYGMKVREVAKASGAMEEMDEALEKLVLTEKNWATKSIENAIAGFQWDGEIESYTNSIKDLKLLSQMLCQRSGINLSGKRDPSKDEQDTRSILEVKLCADLICYIEQLLDEIKSRVQSFGESSGFQSLVKSIHNLQSVYVEVSTKNRDTLIKLGETEPYIAQCSRLSWKQQQEKVKTETKSSPKADAVESSSPPSMPRPNMNLLSSIRTARKDDTSAEEGSGVQPIDMLAAIRAKKKKQVSCPALLEGIKNSPLAAQKKNAAPRAQNPLLAAIREKATEKIAAKAT